MFAINHFLQMGGYAFYVWSAYGITFAILAGNLICAFSMRKRQWQKSIKFIKAQQ